jgi:hypothetical protein
LGFIEEQGTRAVLVEVVAGPEGDWRRPAIGSFLAGGDTSARELIGAPGPTASIEDEGATLGGGPGSGFMASGG